MSPHHQTNRQNHMPTIEQSQYYASHQSLIFHSARFICFLLRLLFNVYRAAHVDLFVKRWHEVKHRNKRGRRDERSSKELTCWNFFKTKKILGSTQIAETRSAEEATKLCVLFTKSISFSSWGGRQGRSAAAAGSRSCAQHRSMRVKPPLVVPLPLSLLLLKRKYCISQNDHPVLNEPPTLLRRSTKCSIELYWLLIC